MRGVSRRLQIRIEQLRTRRRSADCQRLSRRPTKSFANTQFGDKLLSQNARRVHVFSSIVFDTNRV